jgi:hypothetical protein
VSRALFNCFFRVNCVLKLYYFLDESSEVFVYDFTLLIKKFCAKGFDFIYIGKVFVC